MKIVKIGSPFLRKVLKKIYREGEYYTVRFGKLKGLKVYYRRDINFHTLIGLWEVESLKMFDKLIRIFHLQDKEIVVADIGANMGYYSMYFAKSLSPRAKIYSFEPSVSILDVLKRNIAINHFPNVEIVEAACSQESGTVPFYIGENHHSSSMLDGWAGNSTSGVLTQVNSISIDEFFGNSNTEGFPDLIKMDIEGAGVYALKGCDRCLRTKRPLILMESHTSAEDDAVGAVLQNYNYEAYRIENHKWVLHKDRNYLDIDGVWGNMLLIPSEKKAKFSA
jgi:FkbM family methyltransferase